LAWCGRAWFFNLLWQQSFLKKLIRSGMVGLGEAMHGVVRMGLVGQGMVGSGKECPGEVWNGLAWFFNSSLQKDVLKKLDQGEAWHGAVGCGKARHGLVW
jgi:hypothetical protein